MSQHIQIIANGRTTVVGEINYASGAYYSYRKDIFRKYQGYSISKTILEYLKAQCIPEVVVAGLTANTKDFIDFGKTHFDGVDEQAVLPVDYFSSGLEFNDFTQTMKPNKFLTEMDGDLKSWM